MFWCPVNRLRNWVETLANMQQEGLASVFLPHPASLVRASVLGGSNERVHCAAGGRGGSAHGFRWSSCAGMGRKGLGWAEGQRLSVTHAVYLLEPCVCVCV